MKVIVVGATGYVGTEVIRQALSHPSITSIAALARRPTTPPPNLSPSADTTKLKSVICDDFENYSDSVKKDLEGADACIWLLAITPSRSKLYSWDQVRKICVDYTVNGLSTITQLPRNYSDRPFRFIYVSGSSAERDQTKKPWIPGLGNYLLMRGEIENHVLEYAKNSNGAVQACIAKPGLIDAEGQQNILMKFASMIGRAVIRIPMVDVREIAGTLLEQAVRTKGIEKETLANEDLVRIGRKMLEDAQKVQIVGE